MLEALFLAADAVHLDHTNQRQPACMHRLLSRVRSRQDSVLGSAQSQEITVVMIRVLDSGLNTGICCVVVGSSMRAERSRDAMSVEPMQRHKLSMPNKHP